MHPPRIFPITNPTSIPTPGKIDPIIPAIVPPTNSPAQPTATDANKPTVLIPTNLKNYLPVISPLQYL